ncbi:MAG TPA: GH3 auxin-responsive promoter family protein [Bacteroidia bacterium]|nr:GH3 auxin-responsive promoter family protein [Bacteroidia bacterium]
MPIINSIVSWIMKQRMHQIELFIKYPYEVQEDWFRKLIASAKSTEWGQKYDYAGIRSIEDYKSRVPLQDYASIHPYVERLMQGEQKLLWPTEVKWFAKSSGTTAAKSKFIPVTQEALEECHFKGGKDLLSIYCSNHPETKLFNGKLLSMGGSHQLNGFSNESFYGDLSAILIQNLPFWIELFRTPDLSIALMDEWESKIQKMAEKTMKEDVTNISGVPSWTLVLLHKILELTGKKTIPEVWPNLELFIHGAVSFTPYRSQFETLIPSPGMHYYETYNASEGFFGIQDQVNGGEMLLMLDYGIFYEFIPIAELASENPKTLTIDQVKLNENYAIVISTNAGLWRYKIGDTICFTSLSPFRIRVTGRTAHFINAFGEELIVENADKALSEACKKCDCLVRDYTACPVYFSDRSAGAHEWLIEFEKQPADIQLFTETLDQELKNVNSDYEAKRYHDMALRMPLMHVMPENTFLNWLKSQGKAGGQHKVPRLSDNRKIVDEILKSVQHNLV